MRNLKLTNFDSCRIGNLKDCEAFYVDKDYLFVYYDGIVTRFTYTEKASVEILNIRDELYPYGEYEFPKALNVTYSLERKSLFLFLSNGDLASGELKDDNTCSSCIIGSVDGGLKAVKWSPENEILALVTGKDYVIVMNNEFEPLSEVSLHGGGFGAKQFTTVGWGKKETQFRGSEGKYKSCEDSAIDINRILPSDNSIRISWRGDSEYFVVSCLKPDTTERYLRIYDRHGILQYTSETMVGLEHCLHWRPSGNLITSTQRFQNKYNVCFVEKNGLKHGEFTLPFKHDEIIVKELFWNEDSRLLALSAVNVASTVNNNCDKFVLIYSSSNYHWYCKYSISFSNEDKILIEWDKYDYNLLHVLLKKSGSLYHTKYRWMWTINKSRVDSVDSESLVAVIDGCRLLLTSFKSAILPPPMCTYIIEMPLQIIQVGFAQFDTSPNDLFVQLANGQVYLYKTAMSLQKSDQMSYKLLWESNFDKKFRYNICWPSAKTIAFCEIDNEGDCDPSLSFVDIHTFNDNLNFSEEKHPLQSSVALLKAGSESILFLHDNNGATYLFNRIKGEFIGMHIHQKQLFTEMDVVKETDGSFLICGIDKANKFYINNEVVATNITSFHIHEKFLLLTSLKNRLICQPIDGLINAFQQQNLNEINTRRVEIGSRLITSVLKGSKVVLQLPRGNLECIQPRALSLFIIGKYLNEMQYYEAFNIMRQQRINLNLLYDHNPSLFKNNVNIFIEQIKDPAWISLFVSELINEDVTKSMYSINYKSQRNALNDGHDSVKVTTICEFLERVILSMQKPEHYILPLLTTYIKRGEILYIERALAKIKDLKEAENKGEQLVVSFDEAFRHLLYLIDVEDLYKVALGMYDFDLVLLVATKSQKDPKEYLPFLNDWRKMELNYQRYMIDKYLKRYEKALKHLLQCGGDDYFSECLTFIKSNKLFKEALKLVPHTTDRYKQICAYYADELLASNMYEEAGIMYSNAGSYSNAVIAFRKSGNWQEVISCSRKLELADRDLNALYVGLAGELLEGKRFKEASVVYLDYLKNKELAVISLCLGRMFAEAFRIAELFQMDDVVHTHIKPDILECYRNTKAQLSSLGELFITQKKRLSVVREEKSRIAESGRDCDGDCETDKYSDIDTVTTQSYAASLTTNRTFRSAKNKRKQERKMLSLKEGSQYEDMALIVSLHNIVTNCIEMKTELRELNRCLIKINEEPLAEELQESFEKLLKEIDDSTAEIWSPNIQLPKTTYYGPAATSNSIAASFSQPQTVTPTIGFINPRLLIPPDTQANIKWKLEILK